KLAGLLVALLEQRRKHVVDPVQRRREVVLAREGAHLEVLLYGERGEHVLFLRHEAQPARHELVGQRVRDLVAREGDASRGDFEEAENGLERRRLAGAVGPDDYTDVRLLDGDVD